MRHTQSEDARQRLAGQAVRPPMSVGNARPSGAVNPSLSRMNFTLPAGQQASPGFGGDAGAVQSLLQRVQSLENELHTSKLAVNEARTSLTKEKQRSSTLAAELSKAEVSRLSWRKDLDDKQMQIDAFVRELEESRAKLAKVEEDAKAHVKIAEQAKIEKDVALTAKENLASQLRVTKNRLHEAEDELYQAEEVMASLRSELREQQQHSDSSAAHSQFGESEQRQMAEQERDLAIADLKVMELELQAERRKTAMEMRRVTSLQKENGDMSRELSLLSSVTESQGKSAEPASANIENGGNPAESTTERQQLPETQEGQEALHAVNDKHVKERERLANQVRQLLAVVDRLDKGREKLLAEVDVQSLQIEQLFRENVGLAAGLKEVARMSAQWEAQVEELLREKKALEPEASTAEASSEAVGVPNGIDHKAVEQSSDEGNGAPPSAAAELEAVKAENEQLVSQHRWLRAEHARAVQELTHIKQRYARMLGGVELKLKAIKLENGA